MRKKQAESPLQHFTRLGGGGDFALCNELSLRGRSGFDEGGGGGGDGFGCLQDLFFKVEALVDFARFVGSRLQLGQLPGSSFDGGGGAQQLVLGHDGRVSGIHPTCAFDCLGRLNNCCYLCEENRI